MMLEDEVKTGACTIKSVEAVRDNRNQPPELRVAAAVEVANPGVIAFLREVVPQPISPTRLVLEVVRFQLPGVWPAVITTTTAGYLSTQRPDAVEVEVRAGAQSVTAPVKELQ